PFTGEVSAKRTEEACRLPIDLAPIGLHGAARFLALDPLLLAHAIDAGPGALLRLDQGLIDQRGESGTGVLAVHLLGAEAARSDDDLALGGHAASRERL